MFAGIASDGYFVFLLGIVIVTTRYSVPHGMLNSFKRAKGVSCEIDAAALDLGGFKDEGAKRSKVTLNSFAIAEAVSHTIAPEADIVLESTTYLGAYRAAGVCGIVALPPLMIETSGVVLGYDVFAVGFAKFGELADFVDDYAAFFALEYI